MILRGLTLFFFSQGGLRKKFPTKMTSSKGEANHFFPEKEKEMKIC